MSTSKHGLFLVFEGIDGSGKTTQQDILEKQLQSQGFDVRRTLEPTDGKWGQMAMKLITNGRTDTSPEEELSYFINDRREHVDTCILPWLHQGACIIQDRYYFSTAAYQGAIGLDVDMILERNQEFAPDPDAVLYMDVDVDTALKRITQNRGDIPNHFEKKEYLSKVLEIYRTFRAPYLHRIDASQSLEKISQDIHHIITPLLANHDN